MNLATYGENLSAYILQITLLLGMGLILPTLFRLREPGIRLRTWHALLLAILLLPFLQAWHAAETAALGAVITEAWTGRVHAASAGGFTLPPLWQTVFAVVGIGLFLRLLWLVCGLGVLRFMSRSAVPLSPLPPSVEGIQNRLGVRASFMVSRRISSPITFGWRRPVILIPPLFLSLPNVSQEGIACHELLHVKRRDWLYTLFEETVRSLLWFHPLVWMLLRRVGLSREQAVDREVVRITGRRRAYMRALYRLACPAHHNAAFPALFFFNRSHLLQRMALLSKEVPMSRLRLALTALLLAGLLALTGALGAGAFPLIESESDTSPLSTLSAERSAPLGAEESAGATANRNGGEDPESELKPKFLKKIPPIYPDEAKKKQIEGVVKVEVAINPDGKVIKARILESDHEILKQPTLDAVKQWEFESLDLEEGVTHATYTFTVKYKLS